MYLTKTYFFHKYVLLGLIFFIFMDESFRNKNDISRIDLVYDLTNHLQTQGAWQEV